MTKKLPHLIEALLFASEEPLSQAQLAKLAERSEEEVVDAISELTVRLDRDSALQLKEIAGGFRLETRPEYYENIRDMFVEKKSQKLSIAALETLALVAYKQPITAIEVAELRMVTSVSAIIRNLLEKKLIKPVGRKKVIGRPMMYGSTKQFLIHFGLGSLADLPALDDFQEKLEEGGETNEKP